MTTHTQAVTLLLSVSVWTSHKNNELILHTLKKTNVRSMCKCNVHHLQCHHTVPDNESLIWVHFYKLFVSFTLFALCLATSFRLRKNETHIGCLQHTGSQEDKLTFCSA